MASAPAKLPIQTSVQFLSTADGRMSRRIMPGMSRALLPVKSSAPRTTTSTRPMGNTRPLSIFWSDGFPADASGNPYPATTDSSPPSAMNAPAANDMPINFAEKALLDVRFALTFPAASAALAISLGERICIYLDCLCVKCVAKIVKMSVIVKWAEVLCRG